MNFLSAVLSEMSQQEWIGTDIHVPLSTKCNKFGHPDFSGQKVHLSNYLVCGQTHTKAMTSVSAVCFGYC